MSFFGVVVLWYFGFPIGIGTRRELEYTSSGLN